MCPISGLTDTDSVLFLSGGSIFPTPREILRRVTNGGELSGTRDERITLVIRCPELRVNDTTVVVANVVTLVSDVAVLTLFTVSETGTTTQRAVTTDYLSRGVGIQPFRTRRHSDA
jgi:hypothetical protein